MGVTTVTFIMLVLAIAAGGAFYLYRQTGGELGFRLFAPRAEPRLAFIERTKLDGGRKLLLVRRDGVEHLILIGGPIDLVVETGIQSEVFAGRRAEDGYPVSSSPAASGASLHRDSQLPEARPAMPTEPRLPISANGEAPSQDKFELTLRQEVKAV